MTATGYVGLGVVSGVFFSQTATPTYTRGKLVYDVSPEAESPTFFNVEADTEVHLGREIQLPVRNNTGVTIPAGAAVYVNGNHAGTKLPTIALAQANAEVTAACVGLAAHSIENNTIGYVYAIGLAHHNIDTTAFSNGQKLYLSETTPGGLTATKPSAPNYIVPIGIVTRASANGAIYVLPRDPELAAGTGGGTDGVLVVSSGFIETGNVSVGSVAFIALGPAVTVPAVAGHILLLTIDSLLCGNTGSDVQFDAATRVGGADTNWFSSGGAASRFPGGIGDWYVETNRFDSPHSPVQYTVQAGDVVAGSVTVQLYGRTAAGSRTVFANASYPLRYSVANLSVGA